MKTEVYSWRLTRDLKDDIDEAARRERVSVARLLERIAREWLKARAAAAADDEAEQERLRAIDFGALLRERLAPVLAAERAPA